MDILRIIYEYPEPWDSLGIVAWELSKAQVALGHKVTVFCGGWPNRREKKIKEEGITVFSFPRQLKGLGLFLTTSPAVLAGYLAYRLRGKKVDVVHGHAHLPFFFHLYKLFFGFFDKTPYYFQLHVTAAGRQQHTTRPLKFSTKFFEWPLHWLSDWLGVRVAEKVFCVSESVKKEAIEHYHADPEKLVVIGSGVNTNLFRSRPPAESSKAKQLLFVGGLNERKRPELLIEVLPFLPPNYQSMLVGAATRTYKEYLLGTAKKLGVSERVCLKGQVSYFDMPHFYQSSDIFILPSKYEGFPKVVLEALACGLPVLAAGFAAPQDVLPFVHRIRDLTPSALAGQIQRIVEGEGKGTLSSKQFLLVRENYSWSAVARRIESEVRGLTFPRKRCYKIGAV